MPPGALFSAMRHADRGLAREDLMKSLLASALLVLALDGASEIASAQTGQTGDTLSLTPPQRTAIYQKVSREKEKVRTPANIQVSVGVQLPASLELYVLPDDVGAEVPATKFYRYTIVQNQVVIVDPTTMKVVDIIRQ
jgi:hypothetical protein